MAKIAEITKQNPWWTQGANFHAHDQLLAKAKPIFFERKRLPLERGSVYVLGGCRQVGKTTYLKDTVRKLIDTGVPSRNILYLSVDSFVSIRELRNALNYFFQTTQDAEVVYVLLDEITSLARWYQEIKNLADTGMTSKMVVIATGSSSYELKSGGDLLPGRGLEDYYMKPLSFREFVLQTADYVCGYVGSEFGDAIRNLLSALSSCSISLERDVNLQRAVVQIAPFKKELQYFFRMYLITGGFPRSINYYLDHRSRLQPENMDSSVAETYIRDVVGDMRKHNRQEILSIRLLSELVDKYGSRRSFSSVARSVGTTHMTVMDYLDYLEHSFILFVLYAYDFGRKKTRPKADKKVYFLDPLIYHSVVTHLTGDELWAVIDRTLRDEELQSKIVEGLVANHILMHRERRYLKEGWTFLWFYYDRRGSEIDFVVREDKGSHVGVEVKYQGSVDERDASRVPSVRYQVLLSKEDVGIKQKLIIVPVDIFLALLPVSERNL